MDDDEMDGWDWMDLDWLDGWMDGWDEMDGMRVDEMDGMGWDGCDGWMG